MLKGSTFLPNRNDDDNDNSLSSLSSASLLSLPPRPMDCSMDQLLKVRQQLHPILCIEAIAHPYLQKCSLTQQTKCPDVSNYLDEYYYELQNEFIQKQEIDTATTSSSTGRLTGGVITAATASTSASATAAWWEEPFVAMSVGCNKGFDALNTLRRGTFDASLSKDDWGMEMSRDGNLHQSVCAQNVTLPFQVSPNIQRPRRGTVHCFEPFPSTVKRLLRANENLGYEKKGYKIIHAAVSKEEGIDKFQSASTAGYENGGLDNCRNDPNNPECNEIVQVLTLDRYVKENLPGDGPIHILQIDVEGYDADVLLGAGNQVLERVEYLEFEYNWMGSWKHQHLHDIVTMLDDIGFTCYWAGEQKLWRITGCWQLYYDVHTWSNIACANRHRVPKLAEKMENVFQAQLSSSLVAEEGDRENGENVPGRSKDKRKGMVRRRWNRRNKSYQRMSRTYRNAVMAAGGMEHEILSTDPKIMTAKYLTPSIKA